MFRFFNRKKDYSEIPDIDVIKIGKDDKVIYQFLDIPPEDIVDKYKKVIDDFMMHDNKYMILSGPIKITILDKENNDYVILGTEKKEK